MISTLRDAELQIDALKRQQNELIREIRSLNLNSKNGNESVKTVTQFVEVDSQITADQNTVVHRLLHIFDRIKAKGLEITNLTADNIDTTNLDADDIDTKNVEIIGVDPQLHIGSLATAQGFYVAVRSNDLFLSTGVYFNGTAWIATHTYSLVILMSNGGWTFYYNTGNVVGSSVTLSSKFYFGSSGNFYPNQPIAIPEGGTGGITASDARTNLDVYSKAEINVLLSEKDTQIALSNLALTLTTSAQDVPNTNITLAKAGVYSIRASFDIFSTGTGESNVTLICRLVINGVPQSSVAIKQGNPTATSNESITTSQQWIYTALTPGIPIKLQAFKNGGTGISQLNPTNTNLYVQWQRP